METVHLLLEDFEKKSLVYDYQGKIYESGLDESGKYWRKGFPGVVEDLYGKIVFRVGVDFHKGFFWQHHSKKRLNFMVISPLPSLPNCYANFVMSGGGWK